ncbi:S1C family serine protease [Naumannella huperziae]
MSQPPPGPPGPYQQPAWRPPAPTGPGPRPDLSAGHRPDTAPGAATRWAPPTAAPRAASARTGRAVLATAIVTALVVGGAAGAGGAWWGARTVADQQTVQPALQPAPQEPVPPPAEPGSVTDIAGRILPSTVVIELGSGGTGSGFVIDEQGLIMTNNHVIAGARGGNIEVVFDDGSRAQASVVGGSPSYDIAVIRVDERPEGGLKAVNLGDPRSVRVGDGVIAVGAPLGLGGSVTSGIVSAVDRPVAVGGGEGGNGSGEGQAYLDAIQTDAAINPGNSGGPLVDTAGRVIGVNSAILSLGGGGERQGGSIGVGFAIPINQASAIADELIRTGRSSYPVIGAQVQTADDGSGVVLSTVTAGGPAADAGLSSGDVVTTVDGRPVTEMVELIVRVRSKRPGEQIVLGVKGRGDVSVTLGAVRE